MSFNGRLRAHLIKRMEFLICKRCYWCAEIALGRVVRGLLVCRRLTVTAGLLNHRNSVGSDMVKPSTLMV